MSCLKHTDGSGPPEHFVTPFDPCLPVPCPCPGGCTGHLRTESRNVADDLTFVSCDVCSCCYVAEDRPQQKTLSFLIERDVDSDCWVAQCVEHDLVTHARTLTELPYEINLMFRAHILSCQENGIEPFKLRPAPPDVRERFERSRLVVNNRLSVADPDVPVTECRIAA